MDERMRIFKLVEEGTLTAEDASRLMAAMESQPSARPTGLVVTGYEKKMFRIIVDSPSGDKVRIQFPVGAIRKILKATGKLPIPEKDLQGVDLTSMMEAISDCLEAEIEGDFVSVESADGTTVRVFVDQ